MKKSLRHSIFSDVNAVYLETPCSVVAHDFGILRKVRTSILGARIRSDVRY